MTRLHTVTHGDGPRLFVGLHGWNGTTATFDPLVPYLPDDITLMAVDLPGYGQSPPPEDWTLRGVGESVVDTVVDTVLASPELPSSLPSSGEFSLIGSCSGAIVGLEVARAAGDRRDGRAQNLRVDRHVMLEPFAYVPWYLGLFLIPVFGRLAYWSSFGTGLGRWLTNAALAGRADDDTDMMSTFADSPIWAPYRYLQLFDDAGTPADYRDVPGRKHLLRGAHTFAAVRHSVDRWAAAWSDTEVDTIETAGHLILEEAPERVAELAFPPPACPA